MLANKTFANGESPGVYWRKYGGLSPIGEIPGDLLAKALLAKFRSLIKLFEIEIKCM